MSIGKCCVAAVCLGAFSINGPAAVVQFTLTGQLTVVEDRSQVTADVADLEGAAFSLHMTADAAQSPFYTVNRPLGEPTRGEAVAHYYPQETLVLIERPSGEIVEWRPSTYLIETLNSYNTVSTPQFDRLNFQTVRTVIPFTAFPEPSPFGWIWSGAFGMTLSTEPPFSTGDQFFFGEDFAAIPTTLDASHFSLIASANDFIIVSDRGPVELSESNGRVTGTAYGITNASFSLSAVPLPTSVVLLASALGLLLVRRVGRNQDDGASRPR